ncbi:hypothetical protein LO749_20795 [Paracoccus denitrificans]|uniref:hypothetical protein n=1 Tax=Paracoccus denitrificans TaxID=266 RepID=UPI001E475BED|nr:hypothetical protein [Paracoccus denitrificans]UFS66934.1 hypothetical protein LO749_20795 [Paracoccus denitrificans]
MADRADNPEDQGDTEKMSKAPQEILEALHGAIAQDMLNLIQQGGATAAHWSAIAKFLKDNGIDSLGGMGDNEQDAFAKLVAKAREITSGMKAN